VSRGRRDSTSLLTGLAVLGIMGCGAETQGAAAAESGAAAAAPSIATKVSQYTPVRLNAALEKLSDADRRMLPLLMDAARELDTVFRRQADAALDSLLHATPDSTLQRYIAINYGPWDRLDNWAPFLPGVGPRPPGAEFYPHDLTKEEFEAATAKSKEAGTSLRSH
jgi:hypothetical protein